METVISPEEFYYLYSPIASDPAQMFKYTLLGLCFDSQVEAYYKEVYITRNARYKRPRIFLKRGTAFNTQSNYTTSEKFVLSLIAEKEMRLFELRNVCLKRLEGDIRNFKYDYVYKDLDARGFCLSQWLLSSKGRKIKRSIESLIDDLDENIDGLLNDKSKLQIKVKTLGKHLIFLNDETLSKMNIHIINLDELYSLFNPNPGQGSGGSDIDFWGDGHYSIL